MGGGGGESAYQDQVDTTKTKELLIDYRRNKTDTLHLFIGGDCVRRVTDFWFLGVHIEDDLTWSINTAIIKKTQQRLYFLRLITNSHKNCLCPFIVAP